jgi:hypothetical protein
VGEVTERPVRSLGRALALFTTLRLLVFLVVWLLVALVVDEPLLAVAIAVVISALVSVPLLRGYRDDLNRAAAARGARRQAERDRMRSKLDEN